jgi:hypothetical protein
VQSRCYANYPSRRRGIGLYSADARRERRPKTRGFTAIGIFLFFGAMMAILAATTLLWRGTALDRVWTLNPSAYKQLAPLGRWVGIAFLLLGSALGTAGLGCSDAASGDGD